MVRLSCLYPLRKQNRSDWDKLSDSSKGGVIFAIVVGVLLILCFCSCVVYMAVRERRGEPVFSKLEEVRRSELSSLRLPPCRCRAHSRGAEWLRGDLPVLL